MKKQILDFTKMLPGDIILTRDKSAFFSFVIRLFTWSKYSHAAIYIGNSTVYEAVTSGVHTKNIGRWSDGLKGHCVVLRHPNPIVGTMAAQFSSTFHGTRYGYFDALLAGVLRYLFITFPIRVSVSHMFCSRLVANAYSNFGNDICDIKPQQVRPKDILNSKILTKIDIPFVDQPELEKTDYTLLFENSVIELSKAFIKTLRENSIKTNQLVGIFSIVKIIQESNNTELDKQIEKILRASDFYTLVDKEMNENKSNWDANIDFDKWKDNPIYYENKFRQLIFLHSTKVSDYEQQLNAMTASELKGDTFTAFYELYEKLKINSDKALKDFCAALNYLLAN